MELKFSGFKKSACSIGASIKQYKFQNKIVYALAPGRCGADMTTEIINEKCESIGFLGGIMGNTQINGEEFQLGAFTNVIWESN